MFYETAISVSGVSKRYEIYSQPKDRLLQFISFGKRQYFKEFWAVHDVSFSINRGETVGIIGRNGSGKSTLLQMICGTVTPTIGSIVTNGRIAALLELGAGFNAEFTGRENVLLNAEILGFSQEAMKERMADVLAFSELGDFLDRPVKTYSSGMYARLAFSVAIHVDPDILIIDETLAVGDSRFVAKCMKRIKEVQERGATILFVSHDVSSVRTLCQRAIWLNQGALIADDETFPVTGKYMEFMFKDEMAETQILPNNNGAIQTNNTTQSEETQTELNELGIDARPVTHWGSRKGVILSAALCDEHGTRQDILPWGKHIEVVINVCIPVDIPREHLSIAFSIKDLKGSDLIVSTTHDNGITELPAMETFNIRFRMVNPLVTGKYLIFAAVENRMDKDIHYYEYVEGAHYFSSLANEQFFGIVQPTIEQSVRFNKC